MILKKKQMRLVNKCQYLMQSPLRSGSGSSSGDSASINDNNSFKKKRKQELREERQLKEYKNVFMNSN